MRTVTPERFEIIKLSNPGAEIQVRNGEEVVVIPTYDATNDVLGEQVLKLDRSAVPEKFKPGDVLTHTKNGSLMNIVDPIKAMLKIRNGPKSE